MSFAWAAGRPRSTLSAVSRPTRSEVIIPEAPQRSATSEMSPIAERGVAIPSIEFATSCSPDSLTGSTSTSSSMTRCRSWSSVSTRPKIETRTIVSGKSEKRTWNEIDAAYWGRRSRKRSSTARGRAFATPEATSSGPRSRRGLRPCGSTAGVSVTRSVYE